MNGLKLERCDLYEVVEETFNDSVKVKVLVTCITRTMCLRKLIPIPP